jgi:hypothetical protein
MTLRWALRSAAMTKSTVVAALWLALATAVGAQTLSPEHAAALE